MVFNFKNNYSLYFGVDDKFCYLGGVCEILNL